MHRRLFVLAILVLTVTAVVEAPASAQASAPLAVTAVVLNTCVVAVAPLAFVDYSPIAGTPTTGFTEITVTTCFDPHEIAINGCDHGTGVSDRKMKNVLANTTLDYKLDCSTEGDAKCLSNWGDSQGVSTLTGSTGPLQLYRLDGEIPEGQLVPSGAYADNCVVSLQF